MADEYPWAGSGGMHAGWYQRGKYGAKADPAWLQMFLDYANNQARAEFGIPDTMFRIDKNGRLYLTGQFRRNIGYRVTRSFADLIVRAGAKASVGTASMSAAFAAALGAASRSDKAKIRAANNQIASAMRLAVSGNYGAVIGRKVQVPSYRVGRNRYSGGALKKALSAKDLAVGTNEGVMYVNQDRLNLEARHWARMNFGVAPASTPPSYQAKLRFGGKPIGSVGFHVQPRPPMFMPAGFWKFVEGKISSGPLVPGAKGKPRQYLRGAGVTAKNPTTGEIFIRRGGTMSGPKGDRTGHYIVQGMKGGQPNFIKKRGWRFGRGGDDEAHGSYRKSGVRVSRQGFYPMDKAPRYPTRGVVGTNILDWGLKAMVKEFESRYEDLISNWVKVATDSTKSTSPAGNAILQYVLEYTLVVDPKKIYNVKFIEKRLPADAYNRIVAWNRGYGGWKRGFGGYPGSR